MSEQPMDSIHPSKQHNVIDVQVDEAKALAALEIEINRKFVGMPKDIRIWEQLRDELTAKAAELGFVIYLDLRVVGDNWIPVCSIIGRTDTTLQKYLNEEGPDIERKSWDAKRITSHELQEQGVDTELLL